MKLMCWLRFFVYCTITIGFSAAVAGAYEDFFAAIERDDASSVTSLLQRGFDPNSHDPKGQPALVLALRNPSPQVAEALWAHPGLQVDLTNAANETALMMAALRGNVDWMRRLIDRGARVHQQGWSPIHYAASGPEPRAVELLLDRGAPIDARSPNGTTPLMMAARYGSERSVTLLLQRGADRRLRNQRELDAAAFARDGGREALARELAASPPSR
jgi:ankyrin repeat protein